MLDTSQLESLPPDERAAYGAKIRDKLGLPPDASDWIVIGTLTVLVARLVDEAERTIVDSQRLLRPFRFRKWLWQLYLRDSTSDMDKHENTDFIQWLTSRFSRSRICTLMGLEVEDGQP